MNEENKIPEQPNDFPADLLISVKNSIKDVRGYISVQRNPPSALINRLSESVHTITLIIDKLKQKNPPFWYNLYDSLVGHYVDQRNDLRYLSDKIDQLQSENKDLKERYWNAISMLGQVNQEAETL